MDIDGNKDRGIITNMNGFTCGAFDLLHPGHLVFFEKCKPYVDTLIIGLHTDPSIDRPEKNKPIQSTYERYLQLSACKYVDKIIPYDTEKDLENLLYVTDIRYRFVGKDYFEKNFTGKNICEHLGIEIIYLPRNHSWSSSELRNRI